MTDKSNGQKGPKVSVQGVAVAAGEIIAPVTIDQARMATLTVQKAADFIFSEVLIPVVKLGSWTRIEIRGARGTAPEVVIHAMMQTIAALEQAHPIAQGNIRAHLVGSLAQMVVGPAEPDHIIVPGGKS